MKQLAYPVIKLGARLSPLIFILFAVPAWLQSWQLDLARLGLFFLTVQASLFVFALCLASVFETAHKNGQLKRCSTQKQLVRSGNVIEAG